MFSQITQAYHNSPRRNRDFKTPLYYACIEFVLNDLLLNKTLCLHKFLKIEMQLSKCILLNTSKYNGNYIRYTVAAPTQLEQ